MEKLKASFEAVADWCEKHLEDRISPQIGMTFGALIRAYGRRATIPVQLGVEQRTARERDLDGKAEQFLLELAVKVLATTHEGGPPIARAEPTATTVNLTYDPGSSRSHESEDDEPIDSGQAIEGDVPAQPRFSIAQHDMGGWLRVYLGKGEPTGEVARYLSHALTIWMRERPHLRLRFVVPISQDGDTAELHAWYDQVAFPDVSPMASPQR